MGDRAATLLILLLTVFTITVVSQAHFKSPSWLFTTSLSVSHPFVDTPALLIDSTDSIYLQSTWTDIVSPYGSSSVTKITPSGNLVWVSDIVPAGSVLDSRLEASGMAILEQRQVIIAGTTVPISPFCNVPAVTGINLVTGERLWTSNSSECVSNHTLSTVKFVVTDETQGVTFAIGENHYTKNAVGNESNAQFLFIWKLNTSTAETPSTEWLNFYGNNLSHSIAVIPPTVYDVVIDREEQCIYISADFPDPNQPVFRILKIAYNGSLQWEQTFSPQNITGYFAYLALIPGSPKQLFVAGSSSYDTSLVSYRIISTATGQILYQINFDTSPTNLLSMKPASVRYSTLYNRGIIVIANTMAYNSPDSTTPVISSSVLNLDLGLFIEKATQSVGMNVRDLYSAMNWQWDLPRLELNLTLGETIPFPKRVAISSTTNEIYTAGFFSFGFFSKLPAIFYVAKLFDSSLISNSSTAINATLSSCLMGSFRDNSLNPNTTKYCSLCPPGTYGGLSGVSTINQTQLLGSGCAQCIGGTYQSLQGRGQAVFARYNCKALNHTNDDSKEYNTTIRRCELADNWDPYTEAGDICLLCPPGTYSILGSGECKACRTVKIWGSNYCPNSSDDDDGGGIGAGVIIVLVLGGIMLFLAIIGAGVVVYKRLFAVKKGYESL